MKRTTLVLAVASALTLAACGPDYADRTAGQKVDTAVANTQAALDTAGQRTAEVVNTAGQKTVEVVGNAANAVKEVGATIDAKAAAAGRSAEDTAITASIKTDLVKDPELSALKIEVMTRDGVVTLNGVAPTEAAADRAGRIAIAVKGVSEVRNHVVARKG